MSARREVILGRRSVHTLRVGEDHTSRVRILARIVISQGIDELLVALQIVLELITHVMDL